MSNYNTIFILAGILLLCLVGNSKAQASSARLHDLKDVEKLLTSKQFQKLEEDLIMKGSDNDTKAARATLKSIREYASKIPLDEAARPLMDAVLEGIYTAIRLVSTNEHTTNKILDTALEMKREEAADYVRKSLAQLYDMVFAIGVPLEDGHGFSMAKSGGSNHAALKKSMTLMQSAGSTVLRGNKISQQVYDIGCKAGKEATKDAVIAAKAVTDSSSQYAYEYIFKSALAALQGPFQPVSNVQGIIDGLTYNSTIEIPEALAAIDELDSVFKSKASLSKNENLIDAAEILITCLKSTIGESAEGFTLITKAIQKAGEMASRDLPAAIAIVQQGIKDAKQKLVDGATLSFIGTGAARHIGGIPVEALTEMMIEIIMGRVEAFDLMDLLEEAAIIELSTNGAGLTEGKTASRLIIKEAGRTLFDQFVDGGEMGLDAIFGNLIDGVAKKL